MYTTYLEIGPGNCQFASFSPRGAVFLVFDMLLGWYFIALDERLPSSHIPLCTLSRRSALLGPGSKRTYQNAISLCSTNKVITSLSNLSEISAKLNSWQVEIGPLRMLLSRTLNITIFSILLSTGSLAASKDLIRNLGN